MLVHLRMFRLTARAFEVSFTVLRLKKYDRKLCVVWKVEKEGKWKQNLGFFNKVPTSAPVPPVSFPHHAYQVIFRQNDINCKVGI